MSKRTLLLLILVLNVLSTALHYTDNAIFIDQYPEPAWFTTVGVFAAWIVMTPIGLVGYWLYQRQQFLWAYALLGLYSITSVSSPGHYLYPGTMAMTAKMHTLIWLDGISGLSLLAFIIWSAMVWQEWKVTEA